jgi:phospholipase/lecithinase/hemolysin
MVLYVPAAVEVQSPATLDYYPWTETLDDAQRYDLDQGWRFLHQTTDAASVRAYSMKPSLRSSPELPYFSASWHWTEAGHRVAARTVVAYLAAEGVIPMACRDGLGNTR